MGLAETARVSEKVFYYLKKPNPQKKGEGYSTSFALCERDGKDGFGKTKTLKLESIASVNKLYKAGSITFAQALKMAEDILAKLKTKQQGPKKVFHSENAKILDNYWQSTYEHKDQVDKDSMRTDLNRAVSALGEYSLASASKQEIQAALKKSLGETPNLQRRACARLDQILKFIGRDFTLDKMREEYLEVRYCTYREMIQITDKIEDEGFKLLCRVAFSTGARLGECFAIEPRDFNGKMLQITTQIDKYDKRRQTKNRKRRNALVIKKGRPFLVEWIKLDRSEKNRLRHLKHARLFKVATDKAIPGKELVFHDLRHSYAIHLLERGNGLDSISRFLGNSALVCEKYYLGFVATDMTVEMADEITSRYDHLDD